MVTCVWAARARTWYPESANGSRLGYLLSLISCGLFWHNLGAWEYVPTISTTTKRNNHHLEIFKHQHHNNEYKIDTNNYNNIVKDTVSATHTRGKSISSPHSYRSDIQYHQLSKIYSSNNSSQPKHSTLLRTARCGILLNYRITAF